MNTKTLAALLAATALTSVSAFANPVKFTGDLYVGAGSQVNEGNSDFDDVEPLFVGGKGSLYVPFSNTKLSVTVDLFAEYADRVGQDFLDKSDYFNFGGAAHFTYTQGTRYSLGLVGAVISAETPVSSAEDELNPVYGLIGAEGKFMLDRGSFWAQAGYFDGSDGDEDDFITETSFARFGVNYYLEDDLKLSGEVGFYDGFVEAQDGAEATIYRVELEQKVWNTVSLYGAYQFTSLDNVDEEDTFNANVVNVGLRFRFGAGDSGTLMSNEQTNSIGVPPVLHMIAISNEFD